MGALLNPVNRSEGDIKWSLVAHTLAIFSFATIYTVLSLDIQSISYIDNREFPRIGGVDPGPIGYQAFVWLQPISRIASYPLLLNGWLTDGLLVCSSFNSVPEVSNTGRSSSSIVVL
jgi:hypothetical protein